MEVHLYVYDLTRGMARSMSHQLLGIQIDAVYHTSLVFNGIEYFFGMGVQTCYPGTTHHGQPMEIVPLGSTQLPMETVLDYLESLKEVYTAESYDLFAHNCNNFSNDFATFLVGKGIPDHITSLPRRVLETPFGRMLRPQLEQGMRAVTQAPVQPPAQRDVDGAARRELGSGAMKQINGSSGSGGRQGGQVIDFASLGELESHLKAAAAAGSAATIFFTSSTCAPCRIAYPMFDQLAAEHTKALFVKVDMDSARDVAVKYQIRATPTFVTFSRGAKVDEWQGADPNLLKTNVERLVQQTWPPHPHTLLKVPTLQFGSLQPIIYSKVPPLDKLMGKLGDAARDKELFALRNFIQKRSEDAREATLPDMHAIGRAFQTKVLQLPADVRFAAVDLLRCAIADARVSGFFAEEQQPQSIPALISHVNDLELESCPHNLRLVTLHLACNTFSSHLAVKELLRPAVGGNALAAQLVQLVTASLLDAKHPTTRVAAASLAFNLASANYRVRREESREGLEESLQTELAASLVETLGEEESADAAKSLLLALGFLVFCAPGDGEVLDLIKALDAKAVIREAKGQDGLREEVGRLLV